MRNPFWDIKALGWTAPIRAAYELSKRSGAHRALFRPGHLPPAPALVPPFANPNAIPESVRQRTLDYAKRLVEGRCEVFSQWLPMGAEPPWHAVLHSEGTWPPDRPWWEIDIRSDQRAGDVKWTWELARHRHLVILARAAFLEPETTAYQSTLEAHLRSWLAANPPEVGVHWYSNLELALRAVNWLQIIGLAGDSLADGIVDRMARHLYRYGRHLIADLPYTLSTMRNNHLLGDGLGLVALGRAFPGDPAAARWKRLGDWLMRQQMRRHFRTDGSSVEDSVSYTRFVLEMLIARQLLPEAPPEVMQHAVNTARWLGRLGVFEERVPQVGDWDEGRVLASTGDPLDLAPSAALALSLEAGQAPTNWAEFDEVAWYGPAERGSVSPPPAEADGGDIGGGVARAVRGDWLVVLKAGSGPSHGHADLTSLAIWHGKSPVIGDPGTFTYNGLLSDRNAFRSSSAHAVTRIAGLDQLVPHRAFRWQHTATGRVSASLSDEHTVVMVGTHDAYRRLDPPARVVRCVVVGSEGVVVVDWWNADQPADAAVPLAPDWRLSGGELVAGDVTLSWSSSHVASKRPSGWSWTYGMRVPSQSIELADVRSPVWWSVGVASDAIVATSDTLEALGATVRLDAHLERYTVELGGASRSGRI